MANQPQTNLVNSANKTKNNFAKQFSTKNLKVLVITAKGTGDKQFFLYDLN